MGKCIAYTAAAVVFLGIGAIIAGLAVYHTTGCSGKATNPSAIRRRAECLLEPMAGSPHRIEGQITFDQIAMIQPVTVSGNISGLTPGFHGFHIHEFGMQGGNCGDARGHYNPEKKSHGAPGEENSHVGDLGNIEADESGDSYVKMEMDISLWGSNSVVGRGLVVHEGEDDLGKGGDSGSLSTGNAGSRMACCTIFLAPVQ
ncbi:superoxide dismutase [Cu-Zn]-like [Oratosquilla oratoria]|uniref:superoxide dismutase [Cu-Zn]-like n=1 Tax=Oratosquilla oratoria TaxID=337810 RepID=UPI003F75BFB4